MMFLLSFLTFLVSDGPPSYSESYDTFISDFNSHPQHNHHQQHHHHHHQNPNNHAQHHHPHHQEQQQPHNNNNNNSGGGECIMLNSPQHGGGGGQCSPGCPCSGGPFSHQQQMGGGGPDSTTSGMMNNTNNNSSSHHPEYNWDDLPCDPGDYSMFLTKGDSPTTSGMDGGGGSIIVSAFQQLCVLNTYQPQFIPTDSISYTDIDSEMDSKSSGGSHHSVLTDICHVSPPKRKVGRPPKKDKKLKRNGKQMKKPSSHLQFLVFVYLFFFVNFECV
jgi:hypothetical protein